MKQGSKQRLAGAIVLACLAVIIVPIMLDGEGLGSPDFSVSVPAQPPLPQASDNPLQSSQDRPRPGISLPRQDIPGSEAPIPDTDTVAESVAETDQEQTQDRGNLNEEGLPRGWSVRLGAFSDAANAAALQTKLRDEGHRAYTRVLSSANGQLTAVYVGPVLTRTEAAQLRDSLQTDFDLDGQVVEFTIDE